MEEELCARGWGYQQTFETLVEGLENSHGGRDAFVPLSCPDDERPPRATPPEGDLVTLGELVF
ncbi:MAG: hypothetical protein IJM67_00575, partial [Atopobiaceae bacterium]|nr:hypothetical protein [Atopobiaceae bacterium]